MKPAVRPQPLEWLLLVVGLGLVWRYQWVMDDAFVYARYGDNFVLSGFGLVYNAGEFVEGFSSPLWMLWLSLARACGLTYGATWLATGLVCFAVGWWICLDLGRRLGPPGLRIHVPLAYLATNYAFTSFFTSGLETPMVQLVALGYALFLVRPESKLARVLVALSPLVRPELTLAWLATIIFVAIRTRKVPWLVIGVASGLGAAWLGFRIWYYADLFPNTFYLKHGLGVGQGLLYFKDTFFTYHFEAYALIAVASLAVARRRGDSWSDLHVRVRAEMVVVALVVAAYAVSIGGDAMHYRFLAFPFCLLVISACGLAEFGLQGLGAARKRAVFPVITAAVAATSLSLQPAQRDVHALRGGGDPHFEHWISDPGRHRRRANMHELAWYDGDDAGKRAIGEDPDFVYEAVTVSGWCTDAHFRYRERIVHDLGLTDPILARAAVTAERPGHKFGLRWLANDLARAYQRHGANPEAGTLAEAVRRRRAAAWIGENLETIERIERKVYNDHDFVENLALAVDFPGPIEPGTRLADVVFSGYGVAGPATRSR